jgi:hypothetical protein
MLKFQVEVLLPYIKRDINELYKVERGPRQRRNEENFNIVFGVEKEAFSNLAEFITLSR